MSSLSLCENVAQAEESTRVAATWVRDEQLEWAFPNSPTITSGKVLARSNGAPVVA